MDSIPKTETKTVEEGLLEEDIGGNKRQRKNEIEKTKLKIDVTQYDDDSSSEDEDEDDAANTSARQMSKNKKYEGDSDSDMFSDDNEEPEKEKEPQRKKHKGPQFLSESQLELELGIDKSQDFLLNVNEEEDDDDLKQPKIEAFNVNKEMSKGCFDVNGNYVKLQSDSEDENSQQIKDQDQWYSGLKNDDIKKAKEAQLKRDQMSKQKAEVLAQTTTETLIFNLITILNPTETPMTAMQRFNKDKLSRINQKKADENEKLKEKERSSKVMQITELCEGLLNKAITDIYELEREELMGLYQRETGEKWKDHATSDNIGQDEEVEIMTNGVSEGTVNGEKKWEFRWNGDKVVNGPYTNTEMNYWKENYFQGGVQVRLVADQGSGWKAVNDIEKFV